MAYNKEKTAAWYQKNKDRINAAFKQRLKDDPKLAARKRAQKKKWARKNKAKIAAYQKAYYDANPEKFAAYTAKQREAQKRNYQKNKKKIDAKTRIYKATHIATVNEQNRQRTYIRAGREPKPRQFSFYRDFIRPLQKRPEAPEWEFLLALPLTALQRTLVQLARNGLNLVAVAALLGCGQPNVTKQWAGNAGPTKRKLGGIYNKWKRAKG